MTKHLVIYFTLGYFFTSPAFAQWISQKQEDPFGSDHMILALTVKNGKSMALRCTGTEQLEIVFLPNELGDTDTINNMNIVGTKLLIRIDKEKVQEFDVTGQSMGNKVGTIAKLDYEFALKMAGAKRRIAAALKMLGNKFGVVSFGVRGSGREIAKVLKQCANAKKKSKKIEKQ